jgi:16S rRNA G527 N7-methylase RsmG
MKSKKEIIDEMIKKARELEQAKKALMLAQIVYHKHHIESK